MPKSNTCFLCVSVVALLPACATMSPEGKHDWSHQPHHFSTILGSTIDDEESAPTLGLDYEYRTNDIVGLGVVAEYAFEDIDATTLLGVADIHLTDEFVVQTGPGIEFIDDEEEAVYRLGMLYEFEEGGWTVSPQIHYDWTSGEDAVIIGLAFGLCF